MEKTMEHRVYTGSIDELIGHLTAHPVAIVSCITETNEEIIREGKPFLGFYIDENNPIHDYQFDDAVRFIKKYIQEGDVLVVCEEGASRSVAVALAYYLSVGISYEQSIKKLGRGRPYCLIHEYSLMNWAHKKGFIDDKTYEREKIRFK